MPYENFKSKNPIVLSILLNVKKLEISSEQRQALAEIFAKLIKIEEDSQLSK